MKKTLSCLIPCFNEEERILDVLRALCKVKEIDEIICVDDGSTDKTSEVIFSNYPQVKLIKLADNQGKAEAVYQGALKARGDWLILMDGDLRDLDYQEINLLIKKAFKASSLDMLILRKKRSPWSTKIFRFDTLITGLRIVARKHLLDLFKTQKAEGYQLEVALNQYMIDHKKTVYYSYIYSAINTYPVPKYGFWGGILKEIKMYPSLFKYLGFKKACGQMAYFGRQELK